MSVSCVNSRNSCRSSCWYAAPNARRSSRTAALRVGIQLPTRAVAHALPIFWMHAKCAITIHSELTTLLHRHTVGLSNATARTHAHCAHVSSTHCNRTHTHTHEHNMSSALHVHLELDRHCAVLLACLPFAPPLGHWPRSCHLPEFLVIDKKNHSALATNTHLRPCYLQCDSTGRLLKALKHWEDNVGLCWCARQAWFGTRWRALCHPRKRLRLERQQRL
jgi:hypothetical protein